jgi:cold shock CspA family protein
VNRYVLSAILSIEKALTEEQRLPLAELASMTLPDYLTRVQMLQGGKNVRLALLFDQFEEVFKVDETDIDAKHEFFTILGQTLENRSVHALFAMREDSIALLDDYSHLIPSRLKARQRLSLLTRDQAIEAIRKPAEEEGVDFKVADELARDLSRTTTMLSDGSTRVDYGQFVEPVQLQVVCFTVWEKPRRKEKVIDDLSGVSVDTALADYYNDCVAEVALKQKLASERDVRDWFARSLITPRGIRAQVLLDQKSSEGLPNDAIEVLVSKHIVRRELRGGRTWFELAHDRLVNPIRTSNEEWNARYLTPLQTRAAKWHAQNRDPQLLLFGRELIDAIVLKNTDPESLTEIEIAFIDRSRDALPEIERAAVEWWLAGRAPAKLLRGSALKSVERTVQEKGEYMLTPEAKALLAESRAVRRERNVVRYGVATAVVILIGTVGYTNYVTGIRKKYKQLIDTGRAARYYEHTPVEEKKLAEAVAAQTRIDELVESSPGPRAAKKPVIRYFVKKGDSPKLRSALAELGFEISEQPAIRPEPTNCVWYGSAVAPNDAKLVAYAVIRGGSELQTIQQIPRLDKDPNVVIVGFAPLVAGEDPLTADEIEKLPLPSLTRSPAHLLARNEGKVKSYDPDTGKGIVTSQFGAIPFRLTQDPKEEQIRAGYDVSFFVYQNAKRTYAATVRLVEMQQLPRPK